MPRRKVRSGGRVLPAAGTACALAVMLTACAAGVGDRSAPPAPTGSPAAGPAPALRALPPASGTVTARSIPAAAEPVSLTIPAVGITSRLARLHLTPGGALSVPAAFDQAGWYSGGPRPGDIGPAVLAGHVDSTTGPAVFYRLRDLKPGDSVRIRRGDGTVAAFAITELRQYPKNAFPTDAVYGPVPAPELRLITCTGVFDRDRSSYRSNLVVFATLKRP